MAALLLAGEESAGAPAVSSEWSGAAPLSSELPDQARLVRAAWPGAAALLPERALAGLLCHRPWHLSGHCQVYRGEPADSTTRQRSLVDLSFMRTESALQEILTNFKALKFQGLENVNLYS